MPTPRPGGPPDDLPIPAQAVRAWLKAHGHPRGRADALRLRTVRELRDELAALHGVTEEQYHAGRRA